MMKVLKEMEGNKHREEERRLEEEARRKSEEERRLKERREDKEERMINAREMKEGVRKEMLEAMAPWQERTVRVEESTAVLGEEMKRMAEQMKEMKEKLVTRSERSFASVTEHGGLQVDGARPGGARHGGAATGANMTPIGGGRTAGLPEVREKERICGLLGQARRVVGLRPIDKRHVEQTKRRLEEKEGETEEEKEKRAKEGAVMLFLKAEMKMKEADLKELEIVKIFAPVKEEWNTLYVELATSEQAGFLLSFTTYLRRGTTGEDRLEAIKYIPRDLFVRFKAITALGNKARIESGNTINFRVGFGSEDFVLQQKPRGSRGWGPPLPLPADLPAFEHHVALPRGDRSPGEAPGRPALTPEQQPRKRDREGASPSGNTPSPKRLEGAVLVGDATITPVKAGEGLLAAAAGVMDTTGHVYSITETPAKSTKPITRSKKNV